MKSQKTTNPNKSVKTASMPEPSKSKAPAESTLNSEMLQLKSVLTGSSLPITNSHVLQLQRTVGNRAAAQLIKSRTSFDPVVQKAVKPVQTESLSNEGTMQLKSTDVIQKKPTRLEANKFTDTVFDYVIIHSFDSLESLNKKLEEIGESEKEKDDWDRAQQEYFMDEKGNLLYYSDNIYSILPSYDEWDPGVRPDHDAKSQTHFLSNDAHKIVNIDEIDVSGTGNIQESKMKSIRMGIDKGYLLPAIKVKFDKESGKYLLQDGRNRYEVSLEYKYTKIPILIINQEVDEFKDNIDFEDDDFKEDNYYEDNKLELDLGLDPEAVLKLIKEENNDPIDKELFEYALKTGKSVEDAVFLYVDIYASIDHDEKK